MQEVHEYDSQFGIQSIFFTLHSVKELKLVAHLELDEKLRNISLKVFKTDQKHSESMICQTEA